MPGVVSGEGGHDALWDATLAMVKGLSLSSEVAFDLLWREYNPRCEPSWTEKEIQHKITQAEASNLEGGYLLGDSSYSQEGETGQPRSDSETPPGAQEGKKDEGEEKTTTATRLIRLMEEKKTTFFHAPDDSLYAKVLMDDERRATLPLLGKKFRYFLTGAYWNLYKKPANAQAVSDAMEVFKSKAQFEGEKHPVFTRIARKGNVFLNLADKSGRVIEISPEGWGVVDGPDVHFVKSKNLAPMPEPEPDGDIEALRAFVNIPKEDEGLFTLLAVVGEAGCAKTTLTRVLTHLIDPSEADLRSLPKKEQDLMITARNGWLLAFDNVSGVLPWLSDALCRLATGCGFSTRTLYTDSEETIIKVKRPIILNGIDDMASRGDLLSRTILLTLVPVEKRIDEKEFWEQFEKARPKIFGSLLDILSKVLSILPTLEVSDLPRMADFARIGVAVEKALSWPEGAFLRAYEANRNTSSALPLGSLFAESIIEFMKEKTVWEGTATELLSELNALVDIEKWRGLKEWPKTSQVIGNKLRRLAPNLRIIGIDVQRGRSNKRKSITITRQDRTGKTSSPPSQPSPFNDKGQKGDHGDGSDGLKSMFSGRTPQDEEGGEQWDLL